MSTKFQRYYVLTVQQNDGSLRQIRNPITLEFSIVRMAYASMQTGNFRIYNLNQTTRGNIYRNKTDFDDIRSLTVRAGYGNAEPITTIFNGCISEAYSFRDSGGVNFITQLSGYDLNFPVVKSFSNFTIAPTVDTVVTRQSVISQLVGNMINDTPNGLLSAGVIGKFEGTYLRGRTVFGPTWEVLKTETNRNCFIDNSRVFCLPQGQAYEGSIRAIDSSSGLLSTPKKRETYLDIEILFEPAIDMGQRIHLNSTSSPQFNGYYKVLGIQHHGIISDAVGGKCTTILTLDYGASLLDSISEGALG